MKLNKLPEVMRHKLASENYKCKKEDVRKFDKSGSSPQPTPHLCERLVARATLSTMSQQLTEPSVFGANIQF